MAEEIAEKNKRVNAINVVTLVLMVLSIANIAALIHVTYLNSQYYSVKYETTDDVINEIQEIYNKKYIKGKHSLKDAYETSLKGFVKGTGDKYGSYLSPEEAGRFSNEANSVLIGIGVEVSLASAEGDKTKVIIQEVYKGSPAEEGGLSKGDIIKTINTRDVSELSFASVMDSIRGESGEELNITIVRGDIEKNISLIRRQLDLMDVDYEILEGNIGYINLRRFSRETTNTFKQALNVMEEKGVNKYVFDVRGNGGGVLDTAVEITDIIVPKGLIVKVVNNKGEATDYNSDTNEVNGNMVVLVDHNTASAAELFTLALRDYGKAKVIGEKTYGKGTSLEVLKLKNGGMLLISTGLFYTKDSPNIEGVGLVPDIEVLGELEHADIQLERAIEVLK